ncbi:glycosyltransferase [Asaia krungthepensis]|uniref:Glycosyltransferase n=1 Tax=Asaia krungthepensis NRIC 0535 TaxID=1307925 RepID=A0ABQ0PYS4_9PROT|nr:glycosyltransferase [Asaia krungthepensis]GBQ84978.1 glycosyltransferase [Asaia krungthepensis NRIC 0535]
MSISSPAAFSPAGAAISSIGIVLRDFRLGGSERVAIGLANYWASLSLDVVLIVGRGEGPLRELVDPAIEIVDLGLPAWLGDTVLAWALAMKARSVFSSRAIDRCYVPGNSHWPVIPALKSLRMSHRPLVVAQVSSPVCREGRSSLEQAGYDWRMRWLLRGADRITTLSEDLARKTCSIIGRDAVEVVPLPALWDEGRPCAPPAHTMTVLAAGRLVPIKGFDVLIRAFSLVANRYFAAKLVLCGDGPERARLEALVDELGLAGRVVFAGYVPSIRPYLDEARVFVLSSHCESYGAVLLEALAAGRQVISTRCSPAVEALLTGPIAGRSVPVRDADAMAEALCEILAEPAPDCDTLAEMVAPFHVSYGGRLYLSLMQPGDTKIEQAAAVDISHSAWSHPAVTHSR